MQVCKQLEMVDRGLEPLIKEIEAVDSIYMFILKNDLDGLGVVTEWVEVFLNHICCNYNLTKQAKVEGMSRTVIDRKVKLGARVLKALVGDEEQILFLRLIKIGVPCMTASTITNALWRNGIQSIPDIQSMTDRELLNIRVIGNTTLELIRRVQNG